MVLLGNNSFDDIDNFEELPRIEQCKIIRKTWKSKYKNWVEKARSSNSYLRGSHFTNSIIRENLDSYDFLPEDRDPSVDNKNFPSIPYALSIIDRMVQYIRHDEGDILVTAEGKYAYPQIDPRLADVAIGLEEELTQSELVAKMLTARIDLFSERTGINSKLTEIAQMAASQRMTFICVDWIDDETQEEPVHTKIIPMGHYWFDPEASSVADSKYIGYESEMDRDAAERRYSKKIAGEKTSVELYHHYTRDYTIQEGESDTIDGVPVDGVVYKYPGAWRYTVCTKSEVIYDGGIETPGGKPPICVFTWRSLPKSMIGVSVLDSTEVINNNIDRCVQYIMQSAYRGLPKTAVDVAIAADPDDLVDNEVQGYYKYDSSKGAGPAYTYINGAPVPESLYTLLTTLKQLGAEMTGADGIEMEDASKFKLSGDAIEGLAADREGIASRVRDAWYLFLTDYYELVIRFIMAYEQNDVSLTIETPQGPVEFTTNIAAYEFDDAEFEARFDVSVFSPKNMPKNPVRRAQYLLQLLNTVAELSATDPTLARLYIDMADLPNKQSLLAYLNSKIEAEQSMPIEQQVDPEQLKIQERRASDTAKSVGDSLEALAKQVAESDAMMAIEIIKSIPAETNAAYQQVMAGSQPMTQPIQGEVIQ